MRGAEVGEERVGDVADVDLRATSDQEVGDGASNARCAGRDDNAQRLRQRKDVSRIVHSVTPIIRFTCRVAPKCEEDEVA